MTNLEWIVKKQYYLGTWLCEIAFFAKHGSYCGLVCKDCEFMSDDEAVKVLMEEHKEKKQ